MTADLRRRGITDWPAARMPGTGGDLQGMSPGTASHWDALADADDLAELGTYREEGR